MWRALYARVALIAGFSGKQAFSLSESKAVLVS